jgi:hypothetical protein
VESATDSGEALVSRLESANHPREAPASRVLSLVILLQQLDRHDESPVTKPYGSPSSREGAASLLEEWASPLEGRPSKHDKRDPSRIPRVIRRKGLRIEREARAIPPEDLGACAKNPAPLPEGGPIQGEEPPPPRRKRRIQRDDRAPLRKGLRIERKGRTPPRERTTDCA